MRLHEFRAALKEQIDLIYVMLRRYQRGIMASDNTAMKRSCTVLCGVPIFSDKVRILVCSHRDTASMDLMIASSCSAEYFLFLPFLGECTVAIDAQCITGDEASVVVPRFEILDAVFAEQRNSPATATTASRGRTLLLERSSRRRKISSCSALVRFLLALIGSLVRGVIFRVICSRRKCRWP